MWVAGLPAAPHHNHKHRVNPWKANKTMSKAPDTSNPTTETKPEPTKTLFDADLSLGEYERLRRGEAIPKVLAPSKPEGKEAGALSALGTEESSEQKQGVTDSETETTEESETSEDDSTEPEAKKDAEGEEDESAKDGKPKKKGGFQRRIDKLNARVASKDQEIEYWRQQALKTASDPKPDPKVEKAAASPTEGKPKVEDFETHSEFVEALTDWKVDQKEKAREAKTQQKQFQTEQQKLEQSYSEKVKAFASTTEDFHEVLSEVDNIPLSPIVRQLILKSGPELAYALCQDPAEYARINRLPAIDAAEAVGIIKASLVKKPSETKPETKKLTQAPKPIAPVGGGKGSTSKSIYDAGNMSQSEYEALRAEQTKRRRA